MRLSHGIMRRCFCGLPLTTHRCVGVVNVSHVLVLALLLLLALLALACALTAHEGEQASRLYRKNRFDRRSFSLGSSTRQHRTMLAGTTVRYDRRSRHSVQPTGLRRARHRRRQRRPARDMRQ